MLREKKGMGAVSPPCQLVRLALLALKGSDVGDFLALRRSQLAGRD
jgi:hypothetical protein